MAITISWIGVALIEFGIILFLLSKNKKQGLLTQQLQLEEERYRVACEISNDILFEYDIKNDCMNFSQKYSENFGRPSYRENFAKKTKQEDCVEKEDLSVYWEFILSLERGKKHIETEFRMKDKNGCFVWCQILGKTIMDDNLRPVKVVGKIQNIDMQKRELEILQIKARLDPLTNVYNKCVTKELIEQKLKLADLEETHALMIIDIDDFKKINDTYGHMLGDKVLVNVISHIRRMFREEDIVGRIGGDEFVVFMNRVNSREDIANKAVSLFTAFQNYYRHDDENVEITGSVGIAVYPRDGQTYDELLEKADKALYEVKAKGKNSFNIYSAEESLGKTRF